MKSLNEPTTEDALGILRNLEALLPRVEGDSDIKVAVLILTDRLRDIIKGL